MDDQSRPKIVGVCKGILQIKQQIFNNIGDLLGTNIPKSLTHQELEKAQC